MSEDGVFRRRRVVNDEDVDFLGHVNNTVWVSFIVRLAEAHSSSLGAACGSSVATRSITSVRPIPGRS